VKFPKWKLSHHFCNPNLLLSANQSLKGEPVMATTPLPRPDIATFWNSIVSRARKLDDALSNDPTQTLFDQARRVELRLAELEAAAPAGPNPSVEARRTQL
jgi:hypothetical protein